MDALHDTIYRVLSRGGQPLPPNLRRNLQNRLGVDLTRVRIHLDTEANATASALNARAYTLGRHVVFQKNQYRPWHHEGFRLLIHEVAHAVQQGFADPCNSHWVIDPDPDCEARAIAATESIGTRVEIGRLPAPAIQRHLGPPCPSPPSWIEITNLRPKELWLPANQAIELAYRAEHPNHVVLLGSQFEAWRDIRLPRGTPNRAADDAILGALRGLQYQRAPDIIDFTDRVFYEIKTVGYAAAGMEQLISLHALIDTITRQQGGLNWNPDLATWYPPHVLPFPNDSQKKVCTAATVHNQSPTGLILYRVFRRTSPEEEQQLRRRAVAIQELNSELQPMRERIQNELVRVTQNIRSGTDLWIIATPEFYETFVRMPQQERMERTLDLMRVHGYEPRRNPIMGFHNLGWTLVGISIATMAVTFIVVLTGGLALEGAATGAAVGSGTGTSAGLGGLTATEAEVISLSAYRAARAAEATRQAASAAGVLLTVSTVSVARAQGNSSSVTRTGSVRAVPGHLVGPEADYHMGRDVLYGGQRYIIVGRAIVR